MRQPIIAPRPVPTWVKAPSVVIFVGTNRQILNGRAPGPGGSGWSTGGGEEDIFLVDEFGNPITDEMMHLVGPG